ncbi:MAG TPA: hypothetical protein PLC12_02925, partial [Candidatus Methanofastidiosa archaeon]|nr:hypothetical protein [Candidatus Methanofastidiosa archaeon]
MRRYMTVLCLTVLLFLFAPLVASGADSALVGEDLLIAGDEISIDEPVYGDVLAFGGKIYVNAPIHGDLIALGGEIEVHEAIDGKIIVAGGSIDIWADAYKIIVAGGDVTIHKDANIKTNAYIASPDVENRGVVFGEVRALSRDFENYGRIGNLVLYEMYDLNDFGLGGLSSLLRLVMTVVGILVSIGFAILGLVLLKVFNRQFR